ncbi:hypothetical protein BJ975_001578 [Aeromicrobium tamlense]|uniref:Uncharacterized protein n=1 Tax=Aeromicrobium tamlense TaxID=375541 RepID=A0ABX2SH28_9ACTN|nr:hypothetical protein [Aeromicrobium tamlense]
MRASRVAELATFLSGRTGAAAKRSRDPLHKRAHEGYDRIDPFRVGNFLTAS